MSCIREKVPDGYRRKYEQKMQKSIDYILANQNEDRSFGNHISTALAVQVSSFGSLYHHVLVVQKR